jgi:hypothetical protein
MTDKITMVNPWSKAVVWIDPADVTDAKLDHVASLMDDDLREELHSQLAPCSAGEFIAAWAERVGPEEAGKLFLGS